MDLYEYQARDLFERHGVPVLDGIVATTPAEAKAAAATIGGTVVVKAQVKVGGRGKAGGVKLAHSPEEAEAAAQAILGMDIKGHTVRRVMIAARREDRGGVLLLPAARPRDPPLPRHVLRGGGRGDRGARGGTPGRARQDRRRPAGGY